LGAGKDTHKRGSLTFLDRATQEKNLAVEGSQLGALLWVRAKRRIVESLQVPDVREVAKSLDSKFQVP
jgi:hypothetical protein